MPAGANAKREREYESLVDQFRRTGRYKGREEEVASRIVNKQRRQFGETAAAKRRDREGRVPDRNLPIPDYHGKTIAQIAKELGRLSRTELRRIRAYEAKHKNRKGMLKRIDGALAAD